MIKTSSGTRVTSQQKLLDTCITALAANNMKQAIAACRELNTSYPEYLDGWLVAGDIHQRMSRPEAGLIAADRALQLQPAHPAALLQKVDCLLATEQDLQAIELLSLLPQGRLPRAEYHDHAGRILATLDRHEEALNHYQWALEQQPDNPALWYNLATAQRFLGQIKDAETSLDKALAINPVDFEAQAMRSSLRKQTSDHNHLAELENVLQDPQLLKPGRVNIHYALAKELDDLKDYAASFAQLKLGANARRAQMRYDVQQDIDLIDTIITSFDDAFIADEVPACNSDEPIFILGMPRTGTTLVERILSSHSCVYAAGELDTFGRELMRQLDTKLDLSALSREDRIRHSRSADLLALGEAYLAGTRTLTGGTEHFIDKLPFNFLYVGLIKRALPNAKIINLTRHPMATCYAVYKQLFRDAYPFSYDLEDLGRYFIAYQRLMNHWDKLMPGAIYRVKYEDVVADVEGSARPLVEFCQLPWEDACLQFHKNSQASTTASASQVRQPIYRSSLDHWLQYREQLKPLEKILLDAGIDTSPTSTTGIG